MATIERRSDGVYESGADKVKEVNWVRGQTNKALDGLKGELESVGIKEGRDFYYKNDDGKIHYRMGVVEKYLEGLKDKGWNDLNKSNTGAWIMAVQIALESQGCDVGKIDGVFGNRTKDAVRKFQSENGLKVDGAPGKETIRKLLEKLGEVPLDNLEEGEKGSEEGEKGSEEGEKGSEEGEKGSEEGEKGSEEGEKEGGEEGKKEGGEEGKKEGGEEGKKEGNKPEIINKPVDRTEKFKGDKFKYLKRKAEGLLPDKVSLLWSESPNPENPGFTVKINDKYNGSVVKFVKFNFHDYLDGDILNESKLALDISEAKNEWYDERAFQDWIVRNNKYSLEDLFPGQSKSVSLGQFFNKFRGDKLTIDTQSTYFDIYGDKLYLQFDKRWFNAAKWCDQQINKYELKGSDGRYSQEKFKNKLRNIIRKVVEENFK